MGALPSAALLLLLGAGAANASMILALSDARTRVIDVLIIDGQASGAISDDGFVSNTADPDLTVDGFISYNGPVVSFEVDVTMAISKPIIGPARMELDAIAVGGSSSLGISLTDTDFLLGGAGDTLTLVNELVGVTDGTVFAEAHVGDLNEEFGTLPPTLEQGPFGAGAFSDTVSATFVASGSPFSLTESVSIFPAGGTSTSFNKVISVIPEPGMALLLAAGLGGVATRRQRDGRTR